MSVREGVRSTGLARLLDATRNSVRGFLLCYRSEEAFRIEVWLALVLVPAALWLGQTGVERALMLGSLVLVVIVEVLNTAVEVVVDRIGLERHPLSGFAKDLGSCAVLFSLLLVPATWGLVLLGK